MKTRRIITWFFGALWISAAVFGAGLLAAYSLQAGAKGDVVSEWPTSSRLARAKQPTLLVFLHPDCSCSRATVNELDRLLARVGGAVETVAIFIRPKGWSDDRLKSGLWELAKQIPNVMTIVDDGKEAALFGAKTSGHAALFSKEGRLLFEGGITGSRGHEGDNVGRASLEDILRNRKSLVASTDVYGCGIFDSPLANGLAKTIARFLPVEAR